MKKEVISRFVICSSLKPHICLLQRQKQWAWVIGKPRDHVLFIVGLIRAEEVTPKIDLRNLSSLLLQLPIDFGIVGVLLPPLETSQIDRNSTFLEVCRSGFGPPDLQLWIELTGTDGAELINLCTFDCSEVGIDSVPERNGVVQIDSFQWVDDPQSFVQQMNSGGVHCKIGLECVVSNSANAAFEIRSFASSVDALSVSSTHHPSEILLLLTKSSNFSLPLCKTEMLKTVIQARDSESERESHAKLQKSEKLDFLPTELQAQLRKEEKNKKNKKKNKADSGVTEEEIWRRATEFALLLKPLSLASPLEADRVSRSPFLRFGFGGGDHHHHHHHHQRKPEPIKVSVDMRFSLHRSRSEDQSSTCFALFFEQGLSSATRALSHFADLWSDLPPSSSTTQLKQYWFQPPQLLFPVGIFLPLLSEDLPDAVNCRRRIHHRLFLPEDRPLLRQTNQLVFQSWDRQTGVGSSSSQKSRLRDVHVGQRPSAVKEGVQSLVQGHYDYYHYLQDKIIDSGWGCAYRSMQTICSWIRYEGYSQLPVPSHRDIQHALFEMGDKPRDFVGSLNWIGAFEICLCLEKLYSISCRIINFSSGREIPTKSQELAHHFATQGSPIMIGGGVLAYTLLGIDWNQQTGEVQYLILDPHYEGDENIKTIQKSWCTWKRPDLFLPDAFYNFLLPQRPNFI